MILEKEFSALIKKGFFKNKESVFNEALRFFFTHRPDLRIESAIELYNSGKISLMKATEIAGIDIESFKEELKQRGSSIILKHKNTPAFKKGYRALENK